MSIIKYISHLKRKIIGHYKLFTTGNCDLLLYYTGCGCSRCEVTQHLEHAQFKAKLVRNKNLWRQKI